MVSRSKFLQFLAPLVLVMAAHTSYGATEPTVTGAKIIPKPDHVDAVIHGRHFGISPVPLPCVACNIIELQWFFFGQPAEPVTITGWTDSRIELTDIKGGSLGATAIFSIKNDSLGTTVAAATNVPGGPPGPVIKRMKLAHAGRKLMITISGSGFGETPPGIPGNIDTPYFQFLVWVTGGSGGLYPWSAGAPNNCVSLNYETWTDSSIVISGLGGCFGYKASRGYAVVAALYNNPGGGVFGPSAGVGGRIR
jgi:hypothetical protein